MVLEGIKDLKWQMEEARAGRCTQRERNSSLMSFVKSKDGKRDGSTDGEMADSADLAGIGGLSRYGGLAHRASKLDLIDSTTLTSLPIAPPPRPHRKVATKHSGHQQHNEIGSKHGVHDKVEDDDSEMQTTFDEVTFDEEEESQDPIVLVEDYMMRTLPSRRNEDEERYKLTRKRSLATFKSRLHGSMSSSSPSRTPAVFSPTFFNSYGPPSATSVSEKPRNKRAISSETIVESSMGASSKSEDLEAIFGKIPGSDSLKYCELCEKPLYEISSLINSNQRFKKSKIRDPKSGERPSSICEVYDEFICWECVETYEEFFDELYKSEVNSAATRHFGNDNTNRNIPYGSKDPCEAAIKEKDKEVSLLKLVEIFRGIETKYRTDTKPLGKPANNTEKPTLSHRSTFSNLLVGRLRTLHNSNLPLPSRKRSITDDIMWINNLRQKLRWSWKFNQNVSKPSSFNNFNLETI